METLDGKVVRLAGQTVIPANAGIQNTCHWAGEFGTYNCKLLESSDQPFVLSVAEQCQATVEVEFVVNIV